MQLSDEKQTDWSKIFTAKPLFGIDDDIGVIVNTNKHKEQKNKPHKKTFIMDDKGHVTNDDYTLNKSPFKDWATTKIIKQCDFNDLLNNKNKSLNENTQFWKFLKTKTNNYDALISRCKAKLIELQNNNYDLIENMSFDDIASITCYTTNSIYKMFTKSLRSRNDEWLPFCKLLLSALNKLPFTWHNYNELYRGTNSNKIKKYISNYKIGMIIRWDSFTSATTNLQIAETISGKNGIIFEIQNGFHGRNIEPFYAISSQKEICFNISLHFIITNIYIKNTKTIIILKTLPFPRDSKTILWVDDRPINNREIIQQFEAKSIKIINRISTYGAIEYLNFIRNCIDLNIFNSLRIISDMGRREYPNDDITKQQIKHKYAGITLVEQLRKLNYNNTVCFYTNDNKYNDTINKCKQRNIFDKTIIITTTQQQVKKYAFDIQNILSEINSPSNNINETFLLGKIRTQYSDTLNFQDTHIAETAMHFRNNQHQNTVDELLEEWQDYRFDHRDSNIESKIPEPILVTPQRTVEEAIEEKILERHIREMLYNILLAAHYKMKRRKNDLMNELINAFVSNMKQIKISEIIAKYLPNNESDMGGIINEIFDEIVQQYYNKCAVFVEEDLCKKMILKYIFNGCKLSFEMVISENELSFFPLLFTDYCSPIVRYDRIIKKNEKKHLKTQSLQLLHQSEYLDIMKQNKAQKSFMEGKMYLDGGGNNANTIVYYSFPGVIMKTKKKDKIFEKATVYTYDNPKIFLEHDLNWIFTDKEKKDKKMKKIIIGNSENKESHPLSCENYETDPYYKIENKIGKKMEMTIDKIIGENNIIKNRNFLSKPQLLQDWTSHKKQKHTELCEDICDAIIEQNEDENESDDEEEDDDDDYENYKIASKILFELMMKSREEMKLKMQVANITNNINNISYLNMCSLYKYFTDDIKNIKQKIDIDHGYIVQSIVNKIFDNSIDKKKKYKKYLFLKTDKILHQKLHEYIAVCCELICNIFHHGWDLCPIKISSSKKKSLNKYDVKIHIKEDELSMNNHTNKIGYCCFPGIIVKGCWNQFEKQYDENKLDHKQIETYIKAKMWVSLI